MFISKTKRIGQLSKALTSPYLTAFTLAIIVAVLLSHNIFFGIFSGIRLWGDWFNYLIGLSALFAPVGTEQIAPQSIFSHRISLICISLLAGAVISALLRGQFKLQFVSRLNCCWAVLGGLFMAVGATLAGGCTIGGFYTPISLGSPTGLVMLFGLVIGAYFGYQLYLYGLMNISWGKSSKAPVELNPSLSRFLIIVFAVGLLGLSLVFYFSGEPGLVHRSIIIPLAAMVGIVMQSSRFCLSSAIRTPLLDGSLIMGKAVAFFICLSIVLNGTILLTQSIEPWPAIPASFWLGSMLGGILFGIGMVLAGGCGSGVLWRSGEGNGKAVLALFTLAWSSSLLKYVLDAYQLLGRKITSDWTEQSIFGKQILVVNSFSQLAIYLLLAFTLFFVIYHYLSKR